MVAAVAVTACSHTAKVTAVPAAKGVYSADHQYFFFEALRQAAEGNHDAAFDLLHHCLDIDSMAPEVYCELGAYYSELDNDSLTRDYLHRAVSLNPDNAHYHEILARWYIKSGDYQRATAAYEHLYSTDHSRTDVLGILLQLYQQDKDYDKMLSTIERIEQQEGSSEQTVLSKMRVYSLRGDKESAFAALKSLSDEHPNDVNYKLMMGNWLLQNERVDEARAIFLDAQGNELNNEFVAASLYDFYRQQGEDSLATVYRDKILMNKFTATRTKMTIMQTVIRDNEQHGGDSTQVLALFGRVMDASPDDADVAQLNAAYMSLKKMPDDEVNAALHHVLDIAPDNAAARLQILANLWKRQDWNAIIQLCTPALEYNPDEMAFCYYKGLAHFQLDDEQAALAAFRTGVSRINSRSDKEIVSDFYGLMGDIQHKMGMRDEAYAAYDSCLQWKPDNLAALNNYAYYISLEGGDLKRAETMSLKTINAEPNNATYLDTYAWILYQEEKYMEAKQIIERTLENLDSTQNNSTVLDHAGDIYLSCGDTRQALDCWRRALDGADNADEIRKKIRKHEK